MSWKRYFNPVDTEQGGSGNYSPLGGTGNNGMGPAQANYSSYLPDVYVGSPNRIERYGQYNTMDLDSEVNAALDILAEFTSQKNKNNQFRAKFSGEEGSLVAHFGIQGNL